MKALNDYVAQKNSWGKLFGSPALDLSNAQDRKAIASSIDADLSPENLSCDGELSYAEVNRRYTALSRAARQLMSMDKTIKIAEVA